MDDERALKNFIEIADSLRSKFSTKKTLEKNLIKLKELLCNPKHEFAEFFSVAVRVKCSIEDRLNKNEHHGHDFLEAGRLGFKAIMNDLKHGFKYSHDQIINAIENYDKSINIMREQNHTYLSGCISFELAEKLKNTFYYEESYIRFVEASNIFEEYLDLKLTCLWYSICCLVYSRDFGALKSNLQDFLKVSEHFPQYLDAQFLYFLTDVILNPCSSTIDNHFKNHTLTDTDLELYYHIKALCSCYIIGDMEYFRAVENLLLPRASFEQFYIVIEMEYRINNRFEYDM